MNNVENRVVEMKFDNAQFEQAVAKTMDTLDKFKEKLNFEDAGKGMEKVGDLAGNFSGMLGNLGSAIDSVADHFSNLSGVGERVFSALTSSVTGFITSGLNKLTSDIVQGGQSRAMNLEQAKFQLEGILGSAQEVNRVIYDDILPELQGTPFSLDQAAVVMGQLAASGKQSSEEVRQGTRAIAGAAAMTNSSFADMGRIFTKVAGNGRVMGDTLQEMSSRGLNAAADLGKVFDMTEAEVREAVTAGQISYDMFAQAMDELYGDQAKKSTTMYTGALEDLRAALARIGAEPQAVKLELLRDAFNALVPAVDAVNSVLKPFTSSSKELETYINDDGEEVTRYAKAFKGTLASSVQECGWAFQSLFVTLDDNHDILRYNKDNWKELGLEMEKDEDGLKHYYETLKDGSRVEREFGEAVMNPAMYRIMTAAAQSFVNVVAALGKVLGAVGKGIISAFPKLSLDNIADFVEGIRDFTKALVLSEDTLTNIRFVVQAVFTPLGLLVRVLITAAKVLVEFGRLVYHALAPVMRVIMSLVGAAAGLFSGLGKAADHAAADITGMAQKLYNGAKAVAKFFGLNKLLGFLQTGLIKLSSIFTKVGVTSYNFFNNLSDNVKKAGKAIYEKLRIDEFIQKLQSLKDRLKGALESVKSSEGFIRLVEAFNKLKDSIKNLFSSSLSMENITKTLSKFGNKILDMIPTEKMLAALDKFSRYLSKVVTSVAGFVGPKIEGALNFFVKVGSAIKRLFGALKLSTKMFGLLNTLKAAFWALARIVPQLIGFDSFGDILDTIKAKLKSFIEVIKEFVETIVSGIVGDTKNFGDNIKNGLNNLVNDKIVGKIRSFSDAIKVLGEILKKIGGGLGAKLKELYQSLEEGDKQKILSSLTLLLVIFSSMKTLATVGKTINRIGKPIKVVSSAIGMFASIANGFKSMADSFSNLGKALKNMVYLIGITTSLLIFATALSLLGRMDMGTLIQGGIAAIGSLIALSVALAILSKVAQKTKDGEQNILRIGGAMAAVGAAMYLMSKAMVNLSGVYSANKGWDYVAIVGTMAALLAAFWFLAKEFSKMEKMDVSIKSAALAMLGISTAVKIMVGAMQAIGAMKMGDLLKGGLTIAAMLGLMIALSSVAGKSDNVAKAATGLATLAASMLVLWLAIRLFASMDIATFGQGLIFMAGALLTLIGAMALLKLAGGATGAGGIIAVAFAAGVLAAALLALSLIPFGSLIKSMIGLAGVFVILAVVMAVFSAIGVEMLVVGAAFALLGASMLFIGAGALALVVALSMLVPLFMALNAVPEELVKGGLGILATIASGLRDIFLDLAVGVLAFGGALLVAAVAAVILGAGIVLIGAGLLVAGIGLFAFAGGIAMLALTLQALFSGDFLSGIGAGIQNFGEIAMNGLSSIVGKIKGIFSKDKGKEAVQDYTDGAKEAVEGSSEEAGSSWNEFMNNVISTGGDKSAEFKDTMGQFMSGGTESFEEGMPEMENVLGGGLDNMTTMAGTKSGNITDILGGIPLDAAGGINSNKDKYTGAISDMFTAGNKEAKKSAKDNKKVAKDNAKVYSDELNSTESKKSASKAAKELNDSAKQSFKNVKSEFTTIGKNAGEGFEVGIRSKAKDAADEAASMVRKAIKAAKDAEDSSSPSKEFAKLGRWADEGYILGIKSLSGQVAMASADMVQGGIDAVVDAMTYIANVSDMNFDFDPTITPVVDLTNIDQGVSQMQSMFGSSFGVSADFGMNSAAMAARAFTDAQNQMDNYDAINKLANRIGSMTESMNSRSLNVYNTIDGASDPEAFADGLIRSFRLNARTV